MSNPTRRMLTLLSVLQTGRGWPAAALEERLGVSARTLRRDIDRLRDLGYPVQSRPGPGGWYRLVAGTSMPPLLLEDDEAVAVAVGLRLAAGPDADAGADADADADDRGPTGGAPAPAGDAAERALRKLEQVLPARLRPQVSAVGATTEVAGPDRLGVDTGLLALLAGAARRNERLRFDYTTRDGLTSARRVEPYREVVLRGRWYLLGWDLDRGAWRTFRLDRMRATTATGHRFEPRALPANSAAEYLAAGLRAARHRAVITFASPAATVADRLPRLDGVLEPSGDESCRWTVWVDSFEWLAVLTLVVGVDFEIEEPAAFVDHCRALHDRLGRALAG